MPAEHVDIGIELFERERDERQPTLLARGNSPVMREHIVKRLSIQQAGRGVVSRQVADAALCLEQRLLRFRAAA